MEMVGNGYWELGLVIGLQLQNCPVEWICLVLGILSSLLHVCEVHSQGKNTWSVSLGCPWTEIPLHPLLIVAFRAFSLGANFETVRGRQSQL